MAEVKNVLGEPLEICCTAPLTGFYRTGTCETGPQDVGTCRFYWEYPHPGWLLAFTALGPLTFRELATSFHRAGEVCPGLNPPEIPAQNFAPGPAWGDFLRQAGFGDISYRDELWLEGYPDFGLFAGCARHGGHLNSAGLSAQAALGFGHGQL